MHIPFNKPYLTGRETACLERAFQNLRFAGDGPFTADCSRLVEKTLGCERALLTTSCTHALEMAALLLDIKPGDEIITPSFTFVSTINAFVLRGARPVFIDLRPDTLSFHETKNFSCGEGGALIVNRPEFVERAEVIREKGTNRSRFFRGEVDKYTWVDVGSSYVLGDLLAAFLLAQLEELADIQARRRALWEYYLANLSGLAASHGVGLPVVPAHCEQA